MKKTRKDPGTIALLAAVIVLAATLVSAILGTTTRTAQATGIPATNPLFYAGLLEDATTGQPTTGNHNLEIGLYKTQTATTAECKTTLGNVNVTNGRFRVALSSQCVTAIQQEPDLWVEVVVDSAPLPRTKIGAVPYAVEAKESDPVFKASAAAGVTTTKMTSWDSALTSESDPVFNAHAAKNVTSAKMTNWDAAYSWGNHASAGYLSSSSPAGSVTTAKISNWDAAYGWGNHASAGYLKSYTETDPQVGTNATNYVPKWNGSALAQGSIFDNGNVGIGTATPGTWKLNVAGGDNSLKWGGDHSSSNYIRMGDVQMVWGVAKTPAGGGGYVTVTYPAPFLNLSSYNIVATASLSGSWAGTAMVNAVDSSTASLQALTWGSWSVENRDIHYFAIGRWK